MTEHGIQAFYSNLPGPSQTRILECSCGFTACTPTWEESGRLMDQHIREAAEAAGRERVSW